MRYVVGVLIPVLLQCLFVFIIIEMNTGNGSWVGLGALLIGMFAIPATAVINFLYIKSNKDRGTASLMLRCFLIAIVVPVIIILLSMVG